MEEMKKKRYNVEEEFRIYKRDKLLDTKELEEWKRRLKYEREHIYIIKYN